MLAIIFCIEKILTKHMKKLKLLFNLRGGKGEKGKGKGVLSLEQRVSRGLIRGPCTCNDVFKCNLKYIQIIVIIS